MEQFCCTCYTLKRGNESQTLNTSVEGYVPSSVRGTATAGPFEDRAVVPRQAPAEPPCMGSTQARAQGAPEGAHRDVNQTLNTSVEESVPFSVLRSRSAMAGPFEDLAVVPRQAQAEPLGMGFTQAQAQEALEGTHRDVNHLTANTSVGCSTVERLDKVNHFSIRGLGQFLSRQNLKARNTSAAAENIDLTARLAAAGKELQKGHVKILRNIHYGPKGCRGLPVYEDDKQKIKGHLTFGDRMELVKETGTEGGKILWFLVRSLTTGLQGWVVGEVPTELVNCVKMDEYRQREGALPKDAYLGQDFPHEGMFTEGFGGKHKTCLVSASGDNFWREINIELLLRDIGTATVFEEDWGGDKHFTDWVAFYASNCAVYGNFGTRTPKELVVTVKPTANYKTYPRKGVVPHDVSKDIGKAQLKECEWLQSNLPKRGLQWESVEFMTAFQFLKTFCRWTQEDCKKAAGDKAKRLQETFRDLDCAQMAYQLAMVNGSVREAFDSGTLPEDIRDSMNKMEAYKYWADSQTMNLRTAVQGGGPDTSSRNAMFSRINAPDERQSIYEVALSLKQKGLLGPLKGLLKDKDHWEEWHAVSMVMGNLEDRAVREALQVALQEDTDWTVRASAASALGNLGDKAASPLLQAALRDSVYAVRWAAAEALGKLGDKTAVPALQAALEATLTSTRGRNAAQADREELRQRAAKALGKLGVMLTVQAPQEAALQERWRCPVCTFLNTKELRGCEICGTAKVRLPEEGDVTWHSSSAMSSARKSSSTFHPWEARTEDDTDGEPWSGEPQRKELRTGALEAGSVPAAQVSEPRKLGVLSVRVIAAYNLVTARFGFFFGNVSDPYVTLRLGSQKELQPKRTNTIKNDFNPQWNETPFFFPIYVDDHTLHLEVFDENTYASDAFLGRLIVPLHPIIRDQPNTVVAIKDKLQDIQQGELQVEIGFSPG